MYHRENVWDGAPNETSGSGLVSWQWCLEVDVGRYLDVETSAIKRKRGHKASSTVSLKGDDGVMGNIQQFVG